MSTNTQLEGERASCFAQASKQAVSINTPPVDRPSMIVQVLQKTLAAFRSHPPTFYDAATIENMSRLKSRSSATNGLCHVCDKPTTKCCIQCKGAPDLREGEYKSTFYCSSICQHGDWTKHKSTCLAAFERKILYRAAYTAHQLFLFQLRGAYASGSVESLEKKSAAEWCLHMQRQSKGIPEAPFPKELIPDSFDQEAILTRATCNEAVAFIGPLFETMLKGTL